jgi:hypothetical protein
MHPTRKFFGQRNVSTTYFHSAEEKIRALCSTRSKQARTMDMEMYREKS